MAPKEITAETLYVKKGRRYVPWGTTVDRYNHDNDVMRVGQCRLTYCPEQGHKRYVYDVTPDTAAFIAAAQIAQHAMEEAILQKTIAQPSADPVPYTEEQYALIHEFRQRMSQLGGLVPSYWVHGTAYEIAKAGIDAVKQFQENQSND